MPQSMFISKLFSATWSASFYPVIFELKYLSIFLFDIMHGCVGMSIISVSSLYCSFVLFYSH